MAAIDFPNSPSVNDTFTVGSKTWTWNGSYWISDEAATGLDGLNDVTISSPVDGEVIQYDNGEFVNSPVDYADLTSVPNDFTPSAHTHTKSEITDFAHASTHELGGSDEIEIAQSQVTDLVSDLADKQDDVITTQGDLVIGDASGEPVRLPVGSADQVLTSDGTTVSFQDAGGGGGAELITSGSTGGSNLSITSIPQTYRNLILKLRLIENNPGLRINNNSTPQYVTSSTTKGEQSGDNFRVLEEGGTESANDFAEVIFIDYTSSSAKVVTFSSVCVKFGDRHGYFGGVATPELSAITSIQATDQVNFDFELYGVM